jgi:imidazolonepropionase-like amidohydrolase/phosphohistidine phosphatase SixA
VKFLKRLAALAMSCCAAAGAQAEPIAIVGVDVLPMTRTERLSDQTVIVDGERIVAVGPRRSTRIPAGARRIAGRGMTLMPGLVDMHVHLAPSPGAPGDGAHRAMAIMLGHGVTTARGMAGSPNNLVVRDAVEAGTLPGPRFYAAAPGIHANNAANAASATAAVAAARAAGYDLIKSHQIDDLAVWQAVQDEARRAGLPTAGHVANRIGVERAAAARQQIEHLDGVIYALLPEGAPERQIPFAQIPPPQVVLAASRASDAQIEALARRLAAARSWHVPTLGLFEKVVDQTGTPERLRVLPEMRFVPDPVLQQWSQQRAGFLQQSGYTPEAAAAFTTLRRRIVRIFHGAGIPMMTGSDTAQMFHLFGPGLIEEIEALHRAGLTRMQALRSATVVPRDYFRSLPNGGSSRGWRADFGTVEPGARADLILLRGDPSRDLSALRRLDTVIAAGRLHDRAALDRMLDAAATAAKAPPPPAPTSTAPAPAPAGVALQQPVYVIRHLHTPQGQPDPDLLPEGQAAAQQLPALFGNDRIAAIYVTRFKRTQQTAAPVAARFGLTPIVYDPADPQGLIERVRAGPLPALIVGHSNTVPEIVERLGGTRPAPLSHPDFGDVWRIAPGGATTRLRVP